MKLPLSWLKDYVDIDVSVEELESKLFSCGFEVEETVFYGDKIDKIVTAKIIEIEKHPNADKLSVTQIDAGKYGKLQIITAATNIFVGAVVPVALDGATLFNGERIFNGELRGLPSFGMFCSGEELGINDDWYEGASVNGILILDNNFPLGEEVKKLLEIEDVIFDINVTANRPDCQSILGLAREVSAVLNKPFKMPDVSFNTDDNVSTIDTVKINNFAYDLCPRYKGRLVKDVIIGESPIWLKRRLFSMGLRSINNIVDITNFVLLEMGQPMHAFDLSDLEGGEINVRRANEGEKIITLDEKEFTLNFDNLVIADAVKPVALAGIMGGLNSEIKPTTKSVVFECARFARDNVRKTSRALGQKSDSSSRYEKGVDFYSVEYGLKRALHLIDELKAGKIACDEYDLTNVEIKESVIKTTVSKIVGVLGIDVPADTIKEILERLYFNVSLMGDDIEITVPLFREDMESYPDVAEEIIREYGYDNITSTLLKTSAITNGGRNEEQQKIEDFKSYLTGIGFNEAITYSFVPESDYAKFGIELKGCIKPIKILNPISEDLAVMRTTLLPSMIKVVANNVNRKNYSGRLFELAKVYNTSEETLSTLPVEKAVLSIATFGEDEDYYTIKGVYEGIFDTFFFGANVEYKKCSEKFMHPTRSAEVYIDGIKAGYFGQMNPVLMAELDVDKPVFAGELYYDEIKSLFADKIVFKPISKYPIIERDIALLLDDSVEYADIIKAIKEVGGEYLESVKLFDFYKGDRIAEGKKSMAFNLIFVSLERTLNVEEVDEAIKNILDNLKVKTGAELR